MPDRVRAKTEQNKADADISGDNYDRLVADIKRLQDRIETLEGKLAKKDTTIAEMLARDLETLAKTAADRILAAAKDAENKAIIAGLRARLAEHEPLVAATEHVAEATGRVADAAELAVKGGG